MSNEELLKKYEDKINVGQHGFIRLIDTMGSDHSICQAARVSYAKGTKTVSDNEALIRRLIRDHHTSPVEQAVIQLHIKCPIYVRNQMIRHRTFRFNEWSLRYSEAPEEIEHTSPSDWRWQSKSNKQGSEAEAFDEHLGTLFTDAEARMHKTTQGIYQEMLKSGVAREQARKILPLAQYTEFIVQADAHNLLHFLHLRQDPHAQLEIRQFADAIAEIVRDWLPDTYQAFLDYRINNLVLSALEVQALNHIVRFIGIAPFLQWKPPDRAVFLRDRSIISLDERAKFVEKLRRLCAE